MRQNITHLQSLRSKNTKPKLEQTHPRKQSFTLHTTPIKQKHLHPNEKEMALHGGPVNDSSTNKHFIIQSNSANIKPQTKRNV